MENYQMFNAFRQHRLGGGVSILIQDSVKIISVIDNQIQHFMESISICAKFKGKKFIVTEVYRPPNTDDKEFCPALRNLINKVNSCKCNPSFICGDFNYDLTKCHSHKATSDFFNLMLAEGLAVSLSQPESHIGLVP